MYGISGEIGIGRGKTESGRTDIDRNGIQSFVLTKQEYNVDSIGQNGQYWTDEALI